MQRSLQTVLLKLGLADCLVQRGAQQCDVGRVVRPVGNFVNYWLPSELVEHFGNHIETGSRGGGGKLWEQRQHCQFFRAPKPQLDQRRFN